MRMRHFLLVAASSFALSLNLPAWGARGGFRAAPARSAPAPRVVERSSPPQYQPRQAVRYNAAPTVSQGQNVRARQYRPTDSRGDYRHFDRNGHPIVVLPDWGYYGSPYWYDGYPDDGAVTNGPSYGPTDDGLAANSQPANTNGVPLFGQQPGNVQLPPGASPELARANAELTQAEADLDAARQRVRESLAARPDYQAALVQKTAAEERIDALRSSGESNYEKLLPAAQAALEARQQVTQIESGVMANDPQVAEARIRLEAAVANRSALQVQAG
jgi:hypothetical protein